MSSSRRSRRIQAIQEEEASQQKRDAIQQNLTQLLTKMEVINKRISAQERDKATAEADLERLPDTSVQEESYTTAQLNEFTAAEKRNKNKQIEAINKLNPLRIEKTRLQPTLNAALAVEHQANLTNIEKGRDLAGKKQKNTLRKKQKNTLRKKQTNTLRKKQKNRLRKKKAY